MYLSDWYRELASCVIYVLSTRAEIEFRVNSLPKFHRISFDVFAEYSMQSHIEIHNGQERSFSFEIVRMSASRIRVSIEVSWKIALELCYIRPVQCSRKNGVREREKEEINDEARTSTYLQFSRAPSACYVFTRNFIFNYMSRVCN